MITMDVVPQEVICRRGNESLRPGDTLSIGYGPPLPLLESPKPQLSKHWSSVVITGVENAHDANGTGRLIISYREVKGETN